MPERRKRSPSTSRLAQRPNAVTLSVLHLGTKGESVERHLAPLRRVRRVTLSVSKQTSAGVPPRGTAGILWEIGPESGLDRRRVSALLERAPTASYATSTDKHLGDLSRSLGFLHHLSVPLRWPEVQRALGLPGALDMADRLERSAIRLRRLAARADALSDLLRAVNASTDPHTVAAALVARVNTWLPVATWSVVAVKAGGHVEWLAGREVDRALKAPAEALADVVVQGGVPYATDRVAGDRRIGEPLEAAALAFPLVANGVIVGVLVGFDQGRARRAPKWSPGIKAALARLVEPAAFALEHAVRVVSAEALSVTDDLTQLFNSRYLHEVLRKEVKRAARSGQPLSVLFVDLDGFKRINDAHGHVFGSRALVEAAAVIRGAARETDVVARFGGDEFALVLPDTDDEGARHVAERLRDHVARYSFLADRGAGSRLTVSVGVATLPTSADSVDGLLRAADAAMYQAKESGRNGVYVARPGLVRSTAEARR